MEEQHDHRHTDAPRISQEAAGRALLNGEVLVLDVRTPEEYRFSHAPGALNIPLRELEQRLDELPRDRPIITYCT
jgi:rhodanese-related sulfurtransferase